MSYTIEYERKVFVLAEGIKVPAGFGRIEHARHQNDYFLFIKEGCNNIDPRPEEWTLSAWGWNYEIIAKVCARAAWTESGCLKMTNGNTTPEAYLKMYRKEIEDASPFSIDALRKQTGIYAAYLCLGNHELELISKQVDEMQDYFVAKGLHYDYLRYDIDLSSEKQFHAFIAYAHLARTTGGYIGIQSFQNRHGF
ncbi:MAG: hypothetical protein V4539_16525 [Bacteroidota bacterium]